MFEKENADKKIFRAEVDLRILLREMKVSDIMTSKVVSIQADEPFSEVPKRLNNFNIRHLPVVDKSYRLVGLMTQRDLYKLHSPRKLEDGSWYYDEDELNAYVLEQVMLKNPFSMHPEDCVGDALVAMVKNKYGCIPIVSKERLLCGILTRVDILKMAARLYSP
jgi:CBS domain-containing protein